ncbi:6-phosphogluconate dehydrogenase [Mycolicibacterium acapulense]|uniref:6-phosphogluconate dehydrogenase n=2 Tax=Mycobacteriaceae TaxID=1762 RepID=A0AAW5STP9_MYCNV|nr:MULTISPECIES: NAD(P)-dependent oxidoreductase [Mycobacteriaceae]KUH96984.1 6-phosphogluconate dehydrogenase [Mycolicibacterium acapulense]KUI14532.1 6-phosphogluconate dehydrogenase [Mycobacterium lehmannii]MCV7027296.1 NAD(P)-dependent oxidoreductase [Mycolicibacterium novocastrense]GAT07079.1 6-phosphogluconate dehydrogenase [Mycolicibacterium novocastrense]
MTRVGFVGAGRMGAPMVRRLIEAGHEVRALGRTDEKCAALRDIGAQPVTRAADVADGADAVAICVFTDEQVSQVCLDDGLAAAMQPGGALIIHTTGSPATTRRLAAEFTDIDVVDAPVSGGPHNIAAGEVTLFVGGAHAAVNKVRPVLASYGDPILHVGEIGAGQAVKLVNNSLFAAQIGLLRTAVDLGARLGVQEAELLTSLTHGSGTSRVGEFIAARGSVQGFVTDVGEFIGKDVAVVRQTAGELGSDLGLLDEVIDAGILAINSGDSPYQEASGEAY